jgi:hypothetical protein
MPGWSHPSWKVDPVQRHPDFDLLLHEDDELVAELGSPVLERSTLHAWPLSCVQKLRLADGRRLVYKSSRSPTLEADFYAQAHSPLLLKVRTLYHQEGYVCILMDWLDALCLENLTLSEEDVLQIGRNLLARIAAIPGELPFYLDLRLTASWSGVREQILIPLRRLLQSGQLRRVGAQTLETIQTWCDAPEVLEALEVDTGLVHNDLTRDNIFILPDGYRLIDWQRPIYGPRALDLVTLVESAGIDARQHVSVGLLRLKRLLSIHWFVQCAERWFPPGINTYDRQIAQLALNLERGE